MTPWQPLVAATAQTAPASQDGKGSAVGQGMGWVFPILILAIIFFLLIQPQRKREKERRRMLEKLRRGDRVVTIGGVHGVIVSLSDHAAVLEVDSRKGLSLKVSRSAISRVAPDDEGEKGVGQEEGADQLSEGRGG